MVIDQTLNYDIGWIQQTVTKTDPSSYFYAGTAVWQLNILQNHSNTKVWICLLNNGGETNHPSTLNEEQNNTIFSVIHDYIKKTESSLVATFSFALSKY